MTGLIRLLAILATLGVAACGAIDTAHNSAGYGRSRTASLGG